MKDSKKSPTLTANIFKQPLALAGIGILMLGLILGIVFIQRNQELRQQASTPIGDALLNIQVPPGNLAGNTSHLVEMTVRMRTGQKNIDGIQVVANITGDVPDDLQFLPAQIPGLSIVNPTQIITDTANGKKLTLVLITASPSSPFQLTSNSLSLGNFSFTSPANGSFTITFDQTFTKINENVVGTDLLMTVQPLTLAFEVIEPDVCTLEINVEASSPTPTPSNTASPTPTPSNTPSPTPTPTPTQTPGSGGPTAPPTFTPTPTPSNTPSPTPTWTPTPTPTPTPGGPTAPPTFTPTPTSTVRPTPTGLPEAGGTGYTWLLIGAGIVVVLLGGLAILLFL